MKIVYDSTKKIEKTCSFCNRPESKTTHLFGSNAEQRAMKYICASCVIRAKKLLDDAD